MKHIKLAIATLLLTGIITSCDQNKADFDIECGEYQYTINDCTVGSGNDINTGSSIEIYLCIDSVFVPEIKHIKLHTIFSSGSAQDKILEEGSQYFFTNFNTKIHFPRCIYFSTTSYIDYYFTIVTTDNKETDEYHLRVNRPAGAN